MPTRLETHPFQTATSVAARRANNRPATMASRSCSNCPMGCCARSTCNTRSTKTFCKIGGVMSMATAPSDNTSRSTTLP